MMKLSRFLNILIGVCLFGQMLFIQPVSSNPAKAAPLLQTSTAQQDVCRSAQVVLAIDQSDSMVRNDPNKLRYYLPLHVADVLARNFINANAVASRLNRPMRVELAVVQFATGAVTGLEWTTIDPVNDDAWALQRARIEEIGLLDRDDYLGYVDKINNGTNFIAAMNKVEELFNEPDHQQVESCPKRTVLLITDGSPYITHSLDGEKLDDHMALVDNSVQNTLAGKNDILYVTGLNQLGEIYWPSVEDYWLQITRNSERIDDREPVRALKVNNKAEIGYRIDQILNYSLNGGMIQASVGPNTIPPYLDRVVFTFYKPDTDNIIELRDPSGNVMDHNTPGVSIIGTTEGIQSLEIKRPMPGRYELTTTATSSQYYITKNFLFVKARMVTAENGWSQMGCGELRIDLVDSEGQRLPDYKDDRYRLALTASLNGPEIGQTQKIDFIHDMQQGALIAPFTPVWAGNHHLSVEATAVDDDNQRWGVLVYPDADFDLTVDAVTFRIGEVTSEQAGKSCAPFSLNPIYAQITAYNVAKNTPANVCLPVSWQTEGSDFTQRDVSDPDTKGIYTWEGIAQNSGDLQLTLTPSTRHPVTGDLVALPSISTQIRVEQGHSYTFGVDSVDSPADDLSVWVETLLSTMRGNEAPKHLVTGRRLLFLPSPVTVYASLLETAEPLSRPDILPLIVFKPENGTDADSLKVSAWKDEDGALLISMSELSLGCYTWTLQSPEIPCGANLNIREPSGSFCLVSDGPSYLIILFLIVVALIALFFVIRFVLCLILNRLEGFLAIINPQGKVTSYYAIAGRSCWNIGTDPIKDGNIVRLRVRGMFSRKGTFKLIVSKINAGTAKVEKRAPEFCDTNTGCTIHVGENWYVKWVKDPNTLR